MSSEQRSSADPRQDEYRILYEADLRDYLAGLPAVAARLGGDPDSWSISEVGDGNLNLVFIVKGASGGVAVKQALPYVRLVGESWPLPLSRAHYEYLALSRQAQLAPGLVPALLHHNETLALTVMELLEPHIIMRRGLVAGTHYPRFVEDISTFMARTLFFTSDLAVTAGERAAFEGWVLETVETVWSEFGRKFLDLWRAGAVGDAYPLSLFAGEKGALRLEAERQAYMQRLFADTVGFAAAKIIRRIFGLAHNIDFELIEDPRRRAICEARAVRLARTMMVETGSFPTITAVTGAARHLRDWLPEFAN